MSISREDLKGVLIVVLFVVILFAIALYNDSRSYVVYKDPFGKIVRIQDPGGKDVKTLPKDAIYETIHVGLEYRKK